MELPLLYLRLNLVKSVQLQGRNLHNSLLVQCKSSVVLLCFLEEFSSLTHPLQVEQSDSDSRQCHILLIIDCQRVLEVLFRLFEDPFLRH